jgi:hypothetical protein
MPKLVLKIFLFLELKTDDDDSDHHVWRKKKNKFHVHKEIFLGNRKN